VVLSNFFKNDFPKVSIKQEKINLSKINLFVYKKQMKILVAVMSCVKHNHLWNRISSKNVKDLIIFTGGSDKTYYDESNKLLHLKCNDFYDGLPEKMILMIEYVLHSKHFSHITHIIKIDDHDNTFTEDNIENLYKLKELNEHHYIGQHLINKPLGPRDRFTSNRWHFGKVRENCYWHNRPYTGAYVPWLDGGCSYILSKNAMKCIWSLYNSSNLNELRMREIYEDLMMGKILYRNNIFPIEKNYGIKGDK
jgi:hypothetical protein